ncbi:hypothetical protein [Geothrix alkalitolerans]|uniref:hypothetical protein n=1 Tax=Geothrix alkalitolerans TaxID=2922724 RepID=UPI001FAED366|nr:hypothetical protein [Geothrix alkalitolerans]
MEADLANRDRAFPAGGFVHVALRVAAVSRFAVPAEAVVPREGKPPAGIMQADGWVRFQALHPGGTVGLNPPLGQTDGDCVQAEGA